MSERGERPVALPQNVCGSIGFHTQYFSWASPIALILILRSPVELHLVTWRNPGGRGNFVGFGTECCIHPLLRRGLDHGRAGQLFETMAAATDAIKSNVGIVYSIGDVLNVGKH